MSILVHRGQFWKNLVNKPSQMDLNISDQADTWWINPTAQYSTEVSQNMPDRSSSPSDWSNCASNGFLGLETSNFGSVRVLLHL